MKGEGESERSKVFQRKEVEMEWDDYQRALEFKVG